MDKELRKTLASAYERFKRYTNRGLRDSSFYLDPLVELTESKPLRRGEIEKDAKPDIVDPFSFMTGLRFTAADEYLEERMAPEHSISIILGEYGSGKTELVHQICDLLWQNGAQKLLPLPIALADCRSDREILDRDDPPSRHDFCAFLFQNFSKKNSLVKAVQSGRVLLLLDGLDEIVRKQHQYENFFFGVGALFSEVGGPAIPRAVISIRQESIAGLDPDGSTLAEYLRKGKRSDIHLRVFFLNLYFFDLHRIRGYLEQRIPDIPNLLEMVWKNDGLKGILRRPLLLKIFGDLASHADPEELEEIVARQEADAAILIRLYIEKASEEAKRSQEKFLDRRIAWDNDRLAEETLQLYRKNKVHFQAEDVREILDVPETARPQLSEEEIFLGVHKCPFLIVAVERSIRSKKRRLSFSHRCFFEYFTAFGMVRGVVKEKGPTEDLDDLVLNVDMRKFLRTLLNQEAEKHEMPQISFDNVTRRSYGLEESDDLKLWNRGLLVNGEEDWERLEEMRKVLMHGMTDPERADERTDRFVRQFMDLENTGLHPGYLMYNYEAVAVYLMYRRWSKEGRLLSEAYSEKIRARLEQCRRDLAAHQRSEVNLGRLEDTIGRLVERIFSIALRLRYPWVKDYPSWKNEILTLIQKQDTHDRIEGILRDIEHAIF